MTKVVALNHVFLEGQFQCMLTGGGGRAEETPVTLQILILKLYILQNPALQDSVFLKFLI